MPTVRLNNCNVHYETRGDLQNSPIVLLHAFPLDHRVWKRQAEALSSRYYVVMPDFRGHGQSETTNESYSMDLLADDTKALIGSLGLRNIVLGGISMGGYVAMAYARLFPEDLQALILVDTKMEADTRQGRAGRREMADIVLMKGVTVFADGIIPRLFKKESVENKRPFVEEARKTIESMNPLGIVGALQGMAERADSTMLFEKLRIPILIIVGDQDSVTTVEDAKRMAGNVIGSKLVIVPDAGHISTLDQPEKVTTLIQTFLDGILLPRVKAA